MKKVFTIAAIIFALTTKAQSKDSLILRMEMDTATFKQVVQLIQENIPANTLTGKMILNNILTPFYQSARLVPREKIIADKPKQK